MTDRPHPRGGHRGGHRGSGRGGARGGGYSTHSERSIGPSGDRERPKKENILDLSKYMDKKITVKFNGGREVLGVLKGFDQLMNLVLDEVEEVMRDDEGNTSKRSLGLVVVRGTLLVGISPVDGSEEIENPFRQEE